MNLGDKLFLSRVDFSEKRFLSEEEMILLHLKEMIPCKVEAVRRGGNTNYVDVSYLSPGAKQREITTVLFEKGPVGRSISQEEEKRSLVVFSEKEDAARFYRDILREEALRESLLEVQGKLSRLSKETSEELQFVLDKALLELATSRHYVS